MISRLAFPELAQRSLLPEVLQEVVLDPHAGTIEVALRADALGRLSRADVRI